MITKWAYKVVDTMPHPPNQWTAQQEEEELKLLGGQGWELVGALPMYNYDGKPLAHRLFLKRPI